MEVGGGGVGGILSHWNRRLHAYFGTLIYVVSIAGRHEPLRGDDVVIVVFLHMLRR